MSSRLLPTPISIKNSCGPLKRKTGRNHHLQPFHTNYQPPFTLSYSSPSHKTVHHQHYHPKSSSNLRSFPKNSFHSTASHLAPQDPYSVLGVKKDASASEIKKAYYSLAKKYHPDISKEAGAKERYQNVQEAYDLLSDEKKRAAYDQFGPISQQPGFDPNAFGPGGFGGSGNPFGDMFGGDPGDVFSSLFGAFGARTGSRGNQQVFVGDDLEASINIPFEDMARGTSRSINVTPIVDCPPCSGEGIKSGAKPKTCRSCNGTGTMTFVVQSGFTMASTCQSCGGSGKKVDDADLCRSCGGIGKVRDRKQVDVKIPAGVEDGMRIKLSGKGNAHVGGGKGGRPGDLYVKVNVAPSKTFRRQGNNLYTQVKVPFHTALLGGTVRVPTLEKEVEVQVPQGTQPSEELVLKGRGIKHLYKELLGDLIVKFNVSIPRSLSHDQRVALEAYVAATEGTPISTSSTKSSNGSQIEIGQDGKTQNNRQEHLKGVVNDDKNGIKEMATPETDQKSAQETEDDHAGLTLNDNSKTSSSSRNEDHIEFTSQDQNKNKNTSERNPGDVNDEDRFQDDHEIKKKASSARS